MKILLDKIMYERELSVRQVEIMTGIPRSTISDICNGSDPRMSIMELLAKGLKIKITDLFESKYK